MSAAPSKPETSLATLFKYWPHTTPSAFEMAEAGFRYVGRKTNDEVMCPYCHKHIWNWACEDNDDKTPYQCHKELSSECQYFKQELDIASKHSKAPYRPPPPSRSTDQTALSQQSTPTPTPTYQSAATQTAEIPTTATCSPSPPKSKDYLTIQDLYTRYAPLKNRQVTPFKTLPTMSMDDLFKKFKKPATETPQTTPPKARRQKARPTRHQRAIQKKKAYITSGGPSLPRTDNTPSPTSSLPRVDGQRILDSLRASNVRNGSIMRLRQ